MILNPCDLTTSALMILLFMVPATIVFQDGKNNF